MVEGAQMDIVAIAQDGVAGSEQLVGPARRDGIAAGVAHRPGGADLLSRETAAAVGKGVDHQIGRIGNHADPVLGSARVVAFADPAGRAFEYLAAAVAAQDHVVIARGQDIVIGQDVAHAARIRLADIEHARVVAVAHIAVAGIQQGVAGQPELVVPVVVGRRAGAPVGHRIGEAQDMAVLCRGGNREGLRLQVRRRREPHQAGVRVGVVALAGGAEFVDVVADVGDHEEAVVPRHAVRRHADRQGHIFAARVAVVGRIHGRVGDPVVVQAAAMPPGSQFGVAGVESVVRRHVDAVIPAGFLSAAAAQVLHRPGDVHRAAGEAARCVDRRHLQVGRGRQDNGGAGAGGDVVALVLVFEHLVVAVSLDQEPVVAGNAARQGHRGLAGIAGAGGEVARVVHLGQQRVGAVQHIVERQIDAVAPGGHAGGAAAPVFHAPAHQGALPGGGIAGRGNAGDDEVGQHREAHADHVVIDQPVVVLGCGVVAVERVAGRRGGFVVFVPDVGVHHDPAVALVVVGDIDGLGAGDRFARVQAADEVEAAIVGVIVHRAVPGEAKIVGPVAGRRIALVGDRPTHIHRRVAAGCEDHVERRDDVADHQVRPGRPGGRDLAAGADVVAFLVVLVDLAVVVGLDQEVIVADVLDRQADFQAARQVRTGRQGTRVAGFAQVEVAPPALVQRGVAGQVDAVDPAAASLAGAFVAVAPVQRERHGGFDLGGRRGDAVHHQVGHGLNVDREGEAAHIVGLVVLGLLAVAVGSHQQVVVAVDERRVVAPGGAHRDVGDGRAIVKIAARDLAERRRREIEVGQFDVVAVAVGGVARQHDAVAPGGQRRVAADVADGPVQRYGLAQIRTRHIGRQCSRCEVGRSQLHRGDIALVAGRAGILVQRIAGQVEQGRGHAQPIGSRHALVGKAQGDAPPVTGQSRRGDGDTAAGRIRQHEIAGLHRGRGERLAEGHGQAVPGRRGLRRRRDAGHRRRRQVEAEAAAVFAAALSLQVAQRARGQGIRVGAVDTRVAHAEAQGIAIDDFHRTGAAAAAQQQVARGCAGRVERFGEIEGDREGRRIEQGVVRRIGRDHGRRRVARPGSAGDFQHVLARRRAGGHGHAHTIGARTADAPGAIAVAGHLDAAGIVEFDTGAQGVGGFAAAADRVRQGDAQLVSGQHLDPVLVGVVAGAAEAAQHFAAQADVLQRTARIRVDLEGLAAGGEQAVATRHGAGNPHVIGGRVGARGRHEVVDVAFQGRGTVRSHRQQVMRGVVQFQAQVVARQSLVRGQRQAGDLAAAQGDAVPVVGHGRFVLDKIAADEIAVG